MREFMKTVQNKSSIMHTAVFVGLWFINALITILGLPFLLYTKVRELAYKRSKCSVRCPTENVKSKQTRRSKSVIGS